MAWVLVECVSLFKIKYLVEVQDNNPPEWALDTVVCNQAKEFSQKHLDETIYSHTVISEEDALALCRKDNDYIKTWDDEHVKKAFFTSVADYE
jgi:hypothetical protein